MPKFYMSNASIFTNLYLGKKFVSFINSCSYLLGVGGAKNISLITNILCINSVLNQKLDIIANKLDLSLDTNVCFL